MASEKRRKAPAPKRSRPSRPRLRNQILFAFGILALALGAFYTALVVATQIDQIFFPDSQIHLGGSLAKLPGLDSGDSSSSDTSGGGGRINVLVMGLDRRPTDGGDPTRTDTMFVMTIDPAAHTARGLAIPRDLYVDIPSKTGKSSYKDRVNTLYEVGELGHYDGGGATLAKNSVGKLLGIKINYYVLLDFNGFKQIIDLLGGVDVDVAAPGLDDPYYSETELPGDYFPCVFKPGVQHMTSSQALCYARSRNYSPGGDLDRILRQQRIIFAVMDKATQLHVLSDPTNVLNLWKRYKDTVVTDINDLQIPGFAKLATGIDLNQLSFLSLGPATIPYTTSDGAQVLLPSDDGIKQIVEAFMSDNRLSQEAAQVQVQNGTSTAANGQKAVDYLTQLGMPAGAVQSVNVPDSTLQQTQIVDFSGKSYTDELLAAWLGIPKDRIRKATANDQRPGNADIVVMLGPDAKLDSGITEPTPTPPPAGH